MCAEIDPLTHFKRLQMAIFGFSQKETGAESVTFQISSNHFLLHRHFKHFTFSTKLQK